jgi:hypothetical protein
MENKSLAEFWKGELWRREWWLKSREDRPEAGDSLAVEGVLGLISVANEAIKNPGYVEMYLTECSGCCSNTDGSSYRLFSRIPDFMSGEKGHPDTSRKNKETMIAKCYNERNGLAERLSKIISKDARRVRQGVPTESIIYKVK